MKRGERSEREVSATAGTEEWRDGICREVRR